MSSRTIYQMFQATVNANEAGRAVGFKEGKAKEFTYWTYAELADKVQQFRRGLAALGLQKGDRIALISHENRVEWAITDLAAQSLGLVTVPIYGSLPAPQVEYYVRDSGARAMVASDAKQIAKVAEFRERTPALETVIAMEGENEKLGEGVLLFADVYDCGQTQNMDSAQLDAQAASLKPDDTATLIYTSGTTGDPKGAELSHSSLLHVPEVVLTLPGIHLSPDDVFLSFLPLSHITERVGGHYLPLRVGACIVYSQGLMHVGNEITTTVRPTVMLCVPRLYENMHEKAQDGLAKMEESKRKKAEWGVEIGQEAAHRRSQGKSLGLLLGLKYAIASKLILPKVRERVTGGRLRYFVSGGAPLDPQTAKFFLGIGIDLLEGYGLSETSIIALNRPGQERIGTVGPLLPGAEVKFADDGEILMRGAGRMQGYWNKPDATKEAIDAEGWFRTGDVGELSSDGFLKITDRKKDIIVLTNGKKVAPQPIENQLKHSPYIQEAVLLGDKQSTVMALLFPALDKLTTWAKAQNLPADDIAALLARPETQKLFKSEIEQNTSNLADFEKIKRFKVLDVEASIAGGEWTPTLKVKRKFVLQKYADAVASLTRQGEK